MRVLVTGAGGMLGGALVVAAEARGHTVRGVRRDQVDITNGRELMVACGELRPDVVINAAGIVKGRQVEDRLMASVNAVGPHTVAAIADMYGARLVHVSTDCVYSGTRATALRHYEADLPDPVDLYGRSKLAGEVTRAPHLTVRTSFIGLGERGLLAWLLKQQGTVPGYCEAWWNGFTAPYLAQALVELAEGEATGLLHLGTERAWQKCEMVEMLVEAFGLPLQTRHAETPREYRVNRCLGSTRPEGQAFARWDLCAMVEMLAKERAA